MNLSAQVRPATDRTRRHGREVASIEAWVRRGIVEGWCTPKASADVEGRFRRRFVADLSMDCEDPFEVEIFGRYDRACRQTTAIFVDVKTRCRKCEACLIRKSIFWTGRALTEYARTASTYMVTLTISPQAHYGFMTAMQRPLLDGEKVIRDEVRPEGLASATGHYRALAREEGRAVTAYLGRLRKTASFRYLLVAERHTGGGNNHDLPHFHLLLHEKVRGTLIKPSEYTVEGGACPNGCMHRLGPLRHKPGDVCDHAVIRSQWPWGYTKATRCMDVRSASYVCKYTSKYPETRIRASLGYGKDLS